MTNSIHVLIPAAGSGLRFGAGIPKQYSNFLDGLLIDHTISQLIELVSPASLMVGLALEDAHWAETQSSRSKKVTTVIGGDTRADTVSHMLDSLVEVEVDDWILIHDAVRPCIDGESLQPLLDSLISTESSGLSLGRPVHEAVKRVSEEQIVLQSENREGLWLTQTPQVFRYGALLKSMQNCVEQSLRFDDEMMALHHCGFSTEMILGTPFNLKITTRGDLALAESYWNIMRTQQDQAEQ